jgi:hypothetical protein
MICQLFFKAMVYNQHLYRLMHSASQPASHQQFFNWMHEIDPKSLLSVYAELLLMLLLSIKWLKKQLQVYNIWIISFVQAWRMYGQVSLSQVALSW